MEAANFDGRIPGTSIVIDNFASKSGVHFLTHFHSDHYQGLSSRDEAEGQDKENQNGMVKVEGGDDRKLKKRKTLMMKVYCSEVTALLLSHKFPSFAASATIIALEVGVSHCIQDVTQTFNVTLLPANHCPGSVMLFFEGSFGRLLHTGDFRYSEEVMREIKRVCEGEGEVEKRKKKMNIDCLLLDTTFASSKWTSFASKENAVEQVVNIVQQYPSHTQVFLECDMLGTESVFLALSHAFHSLIHVDEEKYLQLSNIPTLSQYLTTNENKSRFHICPSQTFSACRRRAGTEKERRRHEYWIAYMAEKEREEQMRLRLSSSSSSSTSTLRPSLSSSIVLKIKPSTQWFGQSSNVARTVHKFENTPTLQSSVWHVLYSIHSSFQELVSFVSLLRPTFLIPLSPFDAAFRNEVHKTGVRLLQGSQIRRAIQHPKDTLQGGSQASSSSVQCAISMQTQEKFLLVLRELEADKKSSEEARKRSEGDDCNESIAQKKQRTQRSIRSIDVRGGTTCSGTTSSSNRNGFCRSSDDCSPTSGSSSCSSSSSDDPDLLDFLLHECLPASPSPSSPSPLS